MPCTETATLQAIPFPIAAGPFVLTFRLDFGLHGTDPVCMRTLLTAWMALIFAAQLNATNIFINGTLTCKITKPFCTFKMDGAIQNLGPGPSGPLKLVLWATVAEFPSRGYTLAEYTFSGLPAGYQASNFSYKTFINIPRIDGKYYFTISVLELTSSGWLNRDYVTTGRENLNQGEIMTGYKWSVPLKPVIDPPSKLLVGKKLTLSVRANPDLDGIVKGTWADTNIIMEKNLAATVRITGEETDWLRTYTVGKSTLINHKVPTGKLYLDPEDTTGSATITLFFQSATSGVYKNVQTNPRGGGTTWGWFSYK